MDDEFPSAWSGQQTVSRPGDLWRLGDHRLLCGDARDRMQLNQLMERNRAAVAFLDPPYNVRVKSIREFVPGQDGAPFPVQPGVR